VLFWTLQKRAETKIESDLEIIRAKQGLEKSPNLGVKNNRK
jgi:hypothetical protein